MKEQKESLRKFASRHTRSSAIKELPLGEWLSAGRGEVVQINPDRKLSSSTLHCTQPGCKPFGNSRLLNQNVHFSLTAHHVQ